MHNNHDLLDGFDVTVPNVAWVCDYYLGGNHNYDADREAARRVLGVAPDASMAALETGLFFSGRHDFSFRKRGSLST